MTTEREVREILCNPFDRKWTLQGFGMLRTYLDDDEVGRLHIWDVDEMSVPDVSTIHNHPWDFASRIVSGHLDNQRYVVVPTTDGEYTAADLRTGEGGGLAAAPYQVQVVPHEIECYSPGETYSQEAFEYHESLPKWGTVTVIERKFTRPRDYATVCWSTPTWVSAEPRLATQAEIVHFTELALSRWET